MPLYKSIAVNPSTHILIWEITETEKELSKGITLGKNSKTRMHSMKSELHRKAYLSVRHLLAIAQYTDIDLTYSSEGKPSLVDGVEVSITHSHQFSAVIFSDVPVGIDIEKKRDKIVKIASKFTTEKEMEYVNQSNNPITILTSIWGAKESLYKLYGIPGLSFKQHIDVAPFETKSPITMASVNYLSTVNFYTIDIIHFKGFSCVFATPNKP